jgi:plastocyanin
MRTRSLFLCSLLVAVVACEPESSGDVAGDPDTALTPAIDATQTGNLVVTLAEWQVGLSADTVQAGQIDIQIMNRGNEYHRLQIEGNDMEWVSDSLRSNDETLAQVQLTAGTYVLYCPIVGSRGVHRELGMVDTLVVR